MVPEQSRKMSRKPPLTLQSNNRLMTKSRLESKAKSNTLSSTSLSQSSKRKTENLKHTQDHQHQLVSGQEEDIELELDIIGTLTLERAQLDERVLGLEERVRELEMQRKRDVKMLLWMRVEMARFGEWWRWVERGRGG